MLEYASSPVDLTIAQASPNPTTAGKDTRDCCLVQIYPTNIVDGLMRIQKETLTIGRDTGNDLPLVDGSVSRFHAQLRRNPEGHTLSDLGSTNGTFVNDQPITEYKLQGGEIIRLGSFIFKFLVANGIEAQYHSTVYAAMTRDGLTGAFNKSYLLDSLTHEIARHSRCDRRLSVLLMDIDHFKKINDTHGHLVGDEVLREFSQRLSATKRSDDLLCRYGGEEFTLIMSETSLDQAVQLAEKCRVAIESTPFKTSDGEIVVTVSIGAAELPNDELLDAPAILERADVQLYRAKESGRNRVCS